ncbi:MAG: chromosome segregation protein SMC, partial [Parafilimonas sp.]
MKLKQLEIKGFKSFADKTILNFDEGITGIIGPNGCGKSNIIDSIRWVIGEQKISQLRSENLEALVFNGSKTRSASGLAEVSLTFENTKNLLPTEFNIVTVTRRFFKNGESEYRLNDVVCRLKDIHNLFLDTGISNDSYAIIELGMVDDIIKDKDNSRRRMLEQAAGITIYKTRKKEAKLKLDATENDLNRIEDLLFEIQNQQKVIESQAKKAEKYHEIKKEYKLVSVELAKAGLEGFNLTYKDLNKQQEEETDRKHALEAEIAIGDAALEKDRIDFISREKALQEQQHNFNDLVQQLRAKENEKNLATQRLHYLKEKDTSLKEFLERANGQLKNIEDSIQYTELQFQKEETSLATLKNTLEESRTTTEAKRVSLDEKRSSTDKVRNTHLQTQRKQFDAEKKVAVAETSVHNIQRSLTQVEQEQQNRNTQIKQLDEEVVLKAKALDEKQQLLQQLKEQHELTRQQILQSQSELEILRAKLTEENRKFDAKRNEHDLLKSLVDSMEGYPESVKFLHNNKEWNTHAPILSDIIYVQQEYRTALENVLAPYLNYYIVNNVEEGLHAIDLLDKSKKGKANFLLLGEISNMHVENHQPQHTIKALDVIEVDEQYKKLAEYLLGNVFIAENNEALENNSDDNAVVLERSGKYVKGKYTLSGGSIGLFEGKRIGRAKNLEKLREEIAAQEKIINELKANIQQKHNQVIGYNAQLKENVIRQTETEINQLTNNLFAAKNKMENLQLMQQNAAKQLQEMQTRLQNEQGIIEVLRKEFITLNEELTATTASIKEAEDAYKNAEQDYRTASGTFNETNIAFTRLQSKLSALQQEVSYKQTQLKDLHVQIEQNKTQSEEVKLQIAESAKIVTLTEETLRTLLHTKELEEKKLNEADATYYNHRNALQEKESELRHKTKSKEIIDQLLIEIKDKLNELKLNLAGMRERLQVEFKIDLDDILDEPRTGIVTTEELQASADRMRKRLENIGEVNPTAIEAFVEMRKRYEFILEQKQDLVSAKVSLMQTIEEVEATANQQFLDTFNKVRENFQRVFKAL